MITNNVSKAAAAADVIKNTQNESKNITANRGAKLSIIIVLCTSSD